MESIVFSRIAMAGWIFLAAFIGSLYTSDSEAWKSLYSVLMDKDRSAAGIALLGAIIGVGGPPALGFLLERLTTAILIPLKRSMTVYPEVKKFNETLAGEFSGHEKELAKYTEAVSKESAGSALFQVFFYTYADEKLLDWARRRMAQVYASATGLFAVLFGLLLGLVVVWRTTGTAIDWPMYITFWIISLFFAGLLYRDARLQNDAHRDTIRAWIKTLDLSKAFAQKYGPQKK